MSEDKPMNTPQSRALEARSGEEGFTLIETLVAIVILVFGLMAVTNLLLVGATNNSVANQSSAATAIASERLEQLKQVPFPQLTSGTTTDAPRVIQGVGVIQTTVTITRSPSDCQVRFITVTSEGTGAMSRVRSRASFSTFRTCTAFGRGCPAITGPCNP
jgi:prepilin-type N-terminal cleavage/methylation domain-containing protein